MLETDECTITVGPLLKYKFSDISLEHPVGFFCRALSSSDCNYSVYELEIYAVVPAAEHFRIFLLGRPFLLQTDHMALINLPRCDLLLTTRVQRLILRLSQYVFKIAYRRGKVNLMADVLSRLFFARGTEEATP